MGLLQFNEYIKPFTMHRDSSVGTATCYCLNNPGIESVQARFSAPVQIGPGTHPASYTMDTESISRG
jgi:hypothetical protein